MRGGFLARNHYGLVALTEFRPQRPEAFCAAEIQLYLVRWR
jgi:hypothetical protein